MARVVPQLLFGSVAGTLATLLMSLFMLVVGRIGWVTEQAPETITRRSLEGTSRSPVSGRQLDALSVLLHLSFGAISGAVYALVSARLDQASKTPSLIGAAYGTAVWLVSYWGLLPGLGLMPPPPQDQRHRPLAMLVAHWIYGVALGRLVPGGRPSPVARAVGLPR